MEKPTQETLPTLVPERDITRPNRFGYSASVRNYRPTETLLDVLRAERPELVMYPKTHIFIGDVEVRREYWHVVRPKPGMVINIATGPAGDTGIIALRTLATVAIAYAAFQTGAIFFAPGSLGAALVSGGLFAAGMLALNAILPPPQEDMDNNDGFSQALSIAASRNRLEPYAVMPMVVGRMMCTPPFAAKPFTELVGKDQYVTMLYCIGYKNMRVERLRFGSVDFSTLEDLQVQYDIGDPALDTPGGITIYPGTVDEQVVNLRLFSLSQDPTPLMYQTPPDTEWITYDLSAPLGLLRVSNNGKNEDQVAVTTIVQYRLVGAGSWTTLGQHTLAGRSGNSIRQGYRFQFPAPGEYEVRMYRTTPDTDPTLISSSVYNDDIYWNVLRSFKSEYPVADEDAAVIAVRVRATDQINGNPDNFNCIASQLIPDYSGGEVITYAVSTDMHDCNVGQISTIEGATGSGRLPPNWVFSDNSFNGTTLQLLRCGVHQGIPYIDCRLDTALNTTGVTQFVVITPHLRTFDDDTLFPPQPVGANIIASCFFAEKNNLGVEASIGAYEYHPTLGPVVWQSTPMQGLEWQRYTALHTVETAGNKGALLILINIPNGTSVTDYRFRLGCPQLEYNSTNFADTPAINPLEVPAALPEWIPDQVTSNPASIARYMLTDRGNQQALPVGDRLDDDSFVKFHDFCAAKGFTFNQYFDAAGTLWERLQSVCASGRGRAMQPDGKWMVKYDDLQPTPLNVFSPRNSWGYVGEKAYPNEVHAFRVRFLSQLNDVFENDEIIVYRPGYSEDGSNGTNIASLIESLSFPGVTDPAAIWKLCRYYSNILASQMETHSFMVDPEHLTVTPMDRVEYSDEAILVGYGAARIKSFLGNEITTDAEIGLGATVNGIQIRNKNNEVETIQIREASIETDTFTMVSSPLISYSEGDLVTLGVLTKVSLPLLVRDIIPQADLTAKLVCVPYDPGIYIDDGTTPPPYDPHITLPPGLTAPVFADIRSDEAAMDRNANGDFVVRIIGSFAFVGNRENVYRVRVQYRPVLGSSSLQANWISFDLFGDAQEFVIRDVVEGKTYEIRAVYVYLSGGAQVIGPFSAIQTETVIGKTSKPIAPDLFSVTTDSDGTRLYSWRYSKPEDPDIGKPVDFAGVIIRYWDVVNNGWPPTDDWASWGNLKVDGLITESPFESNFPAQGTYRFAIKAVDTGGRESEAPVTSVQDVVLPPGRAGNYAFYRDERTRGWPVGADANNYRINCHVGEFNILEADDETTWQGDGDAPDPGTRWLDVPQWATFTAEDFQYSGENISFGNTTQTYDWYIKFSGINLPGATINVYYATTTNNNPAGNPTTLFVPNADGFLQISARNIRWRIEVVGAVDLAALSEFKITAYVPGLGPATVNI